MNRLIRLARSAAAVLALAGLAACATTGRPLPAGHAAATDLPTGTPWYWQPAAAAAATAAQNAAAAAQ